MRNVIVYVNDRELAEIAAVGIRLAAGWSAEIVHDLDKLTDALGSNPVYAIFSVALQHDIDILVETLDILHIAKAYSTPVVVLTPEPDLCQLLHSFEALPICTAFDPLLLSGLITEAVSAVPAAAPLIPLRMATAEHFDA